MKALSRLVIASVILVVLLIPLATMSDEMPAPLNKTISPGQSTILYAGQTLKFTTDVPLKLSLLPVAPNKIRMRFKAHPSYTGGGSGAPAATIVVVYWDNWSNEVYSGPPPESEAWDGVLNTESGFTEK